MVALIVIALAITCFESTIAWDYRMNGADWSGQGMCGKGGHQSPINLPKVAPTADDGSTLFLKYPKLETSVKVYHNGNSIAMTLPEAFRAGFGVGKGSDGPGVFETEDAEAYRLWQVNFHAPSEHTINGERMPLEMQMMHQRVTGGEGVAVIVVLFNAAPNAYGALLDGIIGKRLPSKPWSEALRKPPLEFAPVLGGSTFYAYEGSLTVPPCEQKVKYFVRKEPVPAAQAQLRAFRKVLQEDSSPKGNYRLPQLLNSRRIVFVGSSDLITAPDKIVKVSKPTLQEEEVPAAAPRAGCTPEVYDLKYKNLHRIETGESQEMTDAKTKYNIAQRNYQAAQNSLDASKRNEATFKRLYESAPGPVEKINVNWDLVAAKQVSQSALHGVPATLKVFEEAHEHLANAIMKECADETARLAAAAKAKAPPKASNAANAEKATRHFKYAEPLISLPHGLGGSPFSDKQPDAENVVLSERIAVNLQQPDVPPDATLTTASQKESGAVRSGSPDTLLALKLPITLKTANEASKGLLKALAKTANIPEGRLEVKEIRSAAIAKVHMAAEGLKLMQVDKQEHPHRSLRHSHL